MTAPGTEAETVPATELRRIRALIIPVDAEPKIQLVQTGPPAYQLLVGGDLDAHHPCAEWRVLHSDSYRATGAPANPLANNLVREADPSFDELLCGMVMIVGTEGDVDTDVPEELVLRADALMVR